MNKITKEEIIDLFINNKLTESIICKHADIIPWNTLSAEVGKMFDNPSADNPNWRLYRFTTFKYEGDDFKRVHNEELIFQNDIVDDFSHLMNWDIIIRHIGTTALTCTIIGHVIMTKLDWFNIEKTNPNLVKDMKTFIEWDSVNFEKYFTSYSFKAVFIKEYINTKFHYGLIPLKLLRDYATEFNWSKVCETSSICNEKVFGEFIEYMDWNKVPEMVKSNFSSISLSFVETCKGKLHFNDISSFSNIQIDMRILSKYKDEIDWSKLHYEAISDFKTLDELVEYVDFKKAIADHTRFDNWFVIKHIDKIKPHIETCIGNRCVDLYDNDVFETLLNNGCIDIKEQGLMNTVGEETILKYYKEMDFSTIPYENYRLVLPLCVIDYHYKNINWEYSNEIFKTYIPIENFVKYSEYIDFSSIKSESYKSATFTTEFFTTFVHKLYWDNVAASYFKSFTLDQLKIFGCNLDTFTYLKSKHYLSIKDIEEILPYLKPTEFYDMKDIVSTLSYDRGYKSYFEKYIFDEEFNTEYFIKTNCNRIELYEDFPQLINPNQCKIAWTPDKFVADKIDEIRKNDTLLEYLYDRVSDKVREEYPELFTNVDYSSFKALTQEGNSCVDYNKSLEMYLENPSNYNAQGITIENIIKIADKIKWGCSFNFERMPFKDFEQILKYVNLSTIYMLPADTPIEFIKKHESEYYIEEVTNYSQEFLM